MAKCEVCGNDYELAFELTAAGKTHVFDSFECAIHSLAPICTHCNCRIIGHGVEANGKYYCCAHCARTTHTPRGYRPRPSPRSACGLVRLGARLGRKALGAARNRMTGLS